MGALTLGLIVPVGARAKAEAGAGPARAQTAGTPWMDAQLRTVADVREAARALGMKVVLVGVPNPDDITATAALLRRRLADADRVLVVGHGPAASSGSLHAIARSCGLPVVGPDGLAVALSADKLMARRQLATRNLPVPCTAVVGGDPDLRNHGEIARLGYPCVIKPRRGSLGQGVARLDDPQAVTDAVARSAESSTEHLVEREIVGRELSVVLLGRRILGVAELVRAFTPAGPRTVEMRCPADLDAISLAGIENLARRACEALGLERGPLRVDLIASARHNEVVLEVEAMPALDRDSVVARVARAAGLPYPELIARVLDHGPRPAAARPTPSLRPSGHPVVHEAGATVHAAQ